MNDDILWIKTRDGSPTLWSNDLSEPFRSTKGAFSESWMAFVGPALRARLATGVNQPTVVGEFGLGPGTNWLLWSVAAARLGLAFEYHVIERDRSFFAVGLEKWQVIWPEITAFVDQALLNDFGDETLSAPVLSLSDLPLPKIYPSLTRAVVDRAFCAHIWFHDPFGLSVNPEAYAGPVIAECAQLWAEDVFGCCYAVNRVFREAIEAQGLCFMGVDGKNGALKRQRSEFYRKR